jgi:Arm DNA-binding domain
MSLSDTAIRNAKSGVRNYKMYDRDGLYLLVKTNGSKLWRHRYHMGGKEQLMALGEYPDVGLATARELCLADHKKLASGIDPMAERRALSEANQSDDQQKKREKETSFESVARKWWIRWSVGKSARHAATTMRRLETDVFTKYGHKHIDEVTPGEIRELMLDVEGRGARDVAKGIHETTSQIFRFAIAHGIGANNPATLFKPRDILLAAKSENHARVDAKDLPNLLVDMDEYDGDAITRFGLKLLAYTFTRIQRVD